MRYSLNREKSEHTKEILELIDIIKEMESEHTK